MRNWNSIVGCQPYFKGIIRLGLIVGGVILILACQTPTVNVEEPKESLKFDTILVLPFEDMAARYGEGQTVRCEICGNVYRTGSVLEKADLTMTEQLIQIVAQWNKYTIVPPSRARGVFSEILAKEDRSLTRKQALVKTAQALHADVVLTGHIFRFEQRVGERYSIDKPASVLFDVDLVNGQNGRLMWNKSFEETQQALLDNLLEVDKFFKRGAAWVTAEELGAYGLKEVLKDFPHP